jgi:hypothetical protein
VPGGMDISASPGRGQRARRTRPATRMVDPATFKEVYDSPHSLPGKARWVTCEADVRELEHLLGMASGTIGNPLWVSGDTRDCPNCGREVSWLDIVSSALSDVHSRQMITKVILGNRKFVNSEAPKAIDNLACFGCGARIQGLRSFKCHNWAYARGDLLRVLEGMS